MLAKTELTQLQKDLLGAANYLEINGWCQFRTSIGRAACLSGAIIASVAGHPRAEIDIGTTEHKRIMDAFIKMQDLLGHPVSWNDSDGRTKEQVVDAFRDAAFK